jgi:Ser/Thr protein kinase RdoA (MazF antagonist)
MQGIRIEPIWEIAGQFSPTGRIQAVQEYGNGNINDTYLVTINEDQDEYLVLQRINTRVFTRPKLIVQNLRTYTEHIDAHRHLAWETESRRWDIPRIWPTRNGKDFYEAPDGSFWRAITFVNHSRSYDTVLNDQHAWEAGYALGRFQSLVSDLCTEKMFDTLKGFHITPHYLAHYDLVRAATTITEPTPEIEFCHEVIAAYRDWAAVLEDAKDRGELRLRVIHGDPKINNFMISDRTGQAVSVIDLDTVKPGLVHYDIGDCLRSSCNPLGEETIHFDNVFFNINFAKAILEGYISVAQEFLTEYDYAYMQDAIRLIPFELGLRFFTDFLAGNKYFKVRHERHNLDRARVQFKLLESIESQQREIQAIITSLKSQTKKL